MREHREPPQQSIVLSAARQPLLVIGLTALLGLGGWALAEVQPRTYRATAEALLSDPARSAVLGGGGRIDSQRHLRNEVTRMSSFEVAVRAAAKVGDGVTPTQVRAATDPVALSELDVIRITAEDPVPARAAALANAVGEAYQEVLQRNRRERVVAAQQELADQVSDVQERIAELNGEILQINTEVQSAVSAQPELAAPSVELERRLAVDSRYQALVTERDLLLAQAAQIRARTQELGLDLATASSGVDVFEPAPVPTRPAGLPSGLGAGLGALIGLIAGVALAAHRDSTSGRIEERRAAELLLGAPLLGTTLRRPPWSGHRLPTVTDPLSPAAEAHHYIVSVMDFALREHDALTVLVTSPRAGDGKTTTAANVAAAAAGDGRDVVLVDADDRTGALTQLLGLTPPRSLLDLADPALRVDDVCTSFPLPGGRRLRVVALPPREESTGVLRTRRFERALDRLIEESGADLILFDAPPFGATSDAAALALIVDACMLVVRRRTPIREVLDMRQQLTITGLPLLGYVFTFDRRRSGQRRREYGRYYAGRSPRARQQQERTVLPAHRPADGPHPNERPVDGQPVGSRPAGGRPVGDEVAGPRP